MKLHRHANFCLFPLLSFSNRISQRVSDKHAGVASVWFGVSLWYRPVVPGGAGGAMVPPIFGISINPISTRGVNYASTSLLAPPDFQNFRRPCDSSGQQSRHKSSDFCQNYIPPFHVGSKRTKSQKFLALSFIQIQVVSTLLKRFLNLQQF